MQTKIQYLGHVIEEGRISSSDEKLQAVKKFPIPNNAKNVQSFLGLTCYFRKFIPQYSIIARPLTELLKANVKFKFEENEKNAFDQLKLLLTQRPGLNLYRTNAETELHTDACTVMERF